MLHRSLHAAWEGSRPCGWYPMGLFDGLRAQLKAQLVDHVETPPSLLNSQTLGW